MIRVKFFANTEDAFWNTLLPTRCGCEMECVRFCPLASIDMLSCKTKLKERVTLALVFVHDMKTRLAKRLCVAELPLGCVKANWKMR